MPQDLVARASIEIAASAANVWDALVNPQVIKQYMFGTTVDSDFKEGSPITWKGEWKGKAYEDKGRIQKAQPGRVLAYSHNDHNVTVELAEAGTRTRVSLSQDGNKNDQARAESEKNWKMMLDGMKKLLEK